MQNEDFIDRIVEKVSQNAVLMRSKYINIIKNRMKLLPSKKAVMKVKCNCEENDFNVLITEKDIEKVYNRFAKKCPTCGQNIKISFNFNDDK